jgi:hypothetical protein
MFQANLAIQETRLVKAQKELDAATTVLRAKEEELAGAQAQFEVAMKAKQVDILFTAK